jgi:hypothetical protein
MFPVAESEGGEGWIKGVQLGKGRDRQKVQQRFRMVKGEEVKQGIEMGTEGVADGVFEEDYVTR